MRIRLLTMQDTEKLETYLDSYKSECMFMCSNLKSVGIEYKGDDYQGEYFGYFSNLGGNLDGVLVHYWNGNIMMHASDKTILEQLTQHLNNNIKRPVAGVLGPNAQAECVIKNLGLTNPPFSINRNEGLFALNLAILSELGIPNDFDVVSAQDISRNLIDNMAEKL